MANKIEQWCESIQSHEGWILPCTKYPAGSASFRNNNPGNFRCSSLVMGELGATKCVNNLAVFPNYETGFKALKQFLIYACTDKLRSYKSTMTLLDFYKVYAPSSDNNNPLNYATCVAKDLGISINTQIKELYEPMQTPETPTQGTFKVLSQKDPKWGEEFIGSSGLKIKNYGCLITCISSLSSWYGKFKDPAWMAKNLSFTPSGLFYWNSITKKELNMRFVYRYYQRNDTKIREILASRDNACILQTEMNGYQYWVALIGYSRILSYKISDPIDGKVRYFNDKYKVITGFAEVTKF